MQVGFDTKLGRNEEIIHASVNPDEAIMLSIQSGFYYGLNSVGVRVWELLKQGPMTVAEIARQVETEFDVDTETCRREILEFLETLLKNNLVHALAS